MTRYTIEDLLPVVRRVVADKGEDFIYTHKNVTNSMGISSKDCVYAWLNEPDCIVGHVLHKLGVPVEYMHHEGVMGTHSIGHLLIELELDHEIEFDRNAQMFLSSMQAEQDMHVPWGKALQYAIAKVDKYGN